MSNEPTNYESQITEWRSTLDANLRREDGWLSLVGLFWLREGEQKIGTGRRNDIFLPSGSAPESVGTITLKDGQVTFQAATDVQIDGVNAQEAVLKDDVETNYNPTRVSVGSITFHLIRRADQIAIRVRDRNNPRLKLFTGRRWYDINPAYRIKATFARHPAPREVLILNSAGIEVTMLNLGRVFFQMGDQSLYLDAFEYDENDPNSLWFLFKDRTNGSTTYGAGRFMTASILEDGTVDLDFNRAYSPPCAFTEYATCPLPTKDNVLPARIEAGERLLSSFGKD
jgi:uncharacterized protein